ncbi:unnamed protein product [Angiostrongylus costaricensis]|uniref:Laminin N-terminal domain-containing protein n=1 Tax=Angiostrongylus costaricensis TaxID=334426 RepID=A0A0R3PKC5_ANGCS|nr:unnamed protein product [Angiostrongylus costaricensis]
MYISPSDGCLATQSKESTISPPGGFIGCIRRLKAPFTRSNYPSTVTSGPFENLNELLATSRTNFVLL